MKNKTKSVRYSSNGKKILIALGLDTNLLYYWKLRNKTYPTSYASFFLYIILCHYILLYVGSYHVKTMYCKRHHPFHTFVPRHL